MMINEVDGGGRMMALFMIDGAKKKVYRAICIKEEQSGFFLENTGRSFRWRAASGGFSLQEGFRKTNLKEKKRKRNY